MQEKSPYFASRLKDCWDGKDNESLTLEDVSVEGFEVVADWIYSNTLPERTKTYNGVRDVKYYIKVAYKAADQLVMEVLQNKLIDVLIERHRQPSWSRHGLTNLHDIGLMHTPFYQLMLRDHIVNTIGPAYALNDDQSAKVVEQINGYPEIMADLISGIHKYSKAPWKAATQGDQCVYHIHADGKKCQPKERGRSLATTKDVLDFSVSPPRFRQTRAIGQRVLPSTARASLTATPSLSRFIDSDPFTS